MKVLVDLNVLLDVLTQRHPHYDSSARLLSLGFNGRIQILIPGHAPTTVHYLAAKSIGVERANEALDWLLGAFEIVPATRDVYLRARSMGYPDFEDAVVTALAEVAHCDRIVTRNVSDFAKSSIRVVEPAQLLKEL